MSESGQTVMEAGGGAFRLPELARAKAWGREELGDLKSISEEAACLAGGAVAMAWEGGLDEGGGRGDGGKWMQSGNRINGMKG